MVDPIFFHRNAVHISDTTPVFTTSSTANGYAIDNCREDNLGSAWKPNTGTSDEWLKLQLSTTTRLGAVGQTAYFCISYDARGMDQTTIIVQYDTSDNTSFAGATGVLTFSLNTALTAGVCHDYGSFTIPSAAGHSPTFYRLMQRNADRGGGTKTVPILYFGMYKRTDVMVYPTDFPQDSVGRYRVSDLYNVGVVRTTGGIPAANEFAKTSQRVDMDFDKSTATFRDAWRLANDLDSYEAPLQAIYIQAQGLYNIPKPNFSLCRQTTLQSVADITQKDVFDLSMSYESEPWL